MTAGRLLGAGVATGLAVVVTAIGSVFAAVALCLMIYDKADLIHLAERLTSAAVGRDVRIAGDADIDVGWVSRLHLSDVSVANAAWAKPADMVELASLDIALDVRSLLTGHLVFPAISLERPRLFLEKNADGAANWDVSRGAKAAAGAAAPEQRSEIPIVRALKVAGAQLRYRDATTDKSIALDLDNLTISEAPADRSVEIAAKGRYQSQPLRLTFKGGAWSRLRSSDEAYPVDVALVVGDLNAKIKGTLTDPVAMKDLDLSFDVKGDDLANLFPLLGIALPPSPPYAMAGHIDHQGTNWQFSSLAGRMGDSDLRGSAGINLGGERMKLTADITSERLALKDLAPVIGARAGGEKGQQADANAAGARTDGKILPNKEIDLSRLNAMDAEIAFVARQLDAPDLPVTGLDAKVSLEDGVLRIHPAVLDVAGGKVRTFLSLYGSRKPVEVDLDTALSQINLKALMHGHDFAEQSSGTLGGRVELHATGASVAALLGSASGHTFVVMSGGKISHLLVELAGLDIAESLGVLIEGDKAIPIRCLVADFTAQDGLFTTNTMLVDTTDTNIGGSGTIDMRNERLDLTLYPLSKDFSPLSIRAPITIDGAISSPTVFPDPAGIGVDTTIKKIINGILTPVLGLLPPIDAGVGENSDCAGLIKRAKSDL
ncbi:MAG: AsmA family protein [Rhodospirillales bacterium]|nr:AsmA family protein [Rhodospirillales bacterium]